MSIATPKNLSLTEIISAGYRALHRRLWVMLIPALMGGYLWLGAPIALTPLATGVQTDLAMVGELIGQEGEGVRLAQAVLMTDLRLALAWLNFVPMLAPTEGPVVPLMGLEHQVNWPRMLLTIGVVNLLALVFSSYFLTLLSESVSGVYLPLVGSLQRAFAVALALVGYWLVLAGIGLLLALPFLALSIIVIVALPGTALAILLAWYIVLFWAYIYTCFAPEAILLSRVGPLQAIVASINIVRHNLAETLLLLLLNLLIVNGLGLIWRQLAAMPVGLPVALLGSAYIGSGLTAARMEFYRAHLAR